MSKYAAFLGQVTVDSDHNTIRCVEDATTADVTLVEGTYFLRGDGAAGDLCAAIATALATNGAGTNNTYTVSLACSVDSAAPAATVTITRATGTGSFSILWAHANTTFDPAFIGFAETNTAHDATAKASTLSPSSLWIASDLLESYEPEEEYDVTVVRARPGRLKGQRTGGPHDRRTVIMNYLDVARVLAEENLADPTATFERFHQRQGDGKRMEFHAVALSSGSTLAALSASTEIGDCWHLDEETASVFAPERLEPGLPLYSISLGLLGYIA
jgi:hypothetical protein